MEIRIAEHADRLEIVGLYRRSQAATALPDPNLLPPSELDNHLYSRNAIERYVAVQAGSIVGHALTEPANAAQEQKWREAIDNDADIRLLEIGGAFVEPQLSDTGIGTELLLHSIDRVRQLRARPVSATWASNERVKRTFQKHGGKYAGVQATPLGEVALFVF